MSKQRIAINIVATYLQSALSLVVGIFSLRWAYLALGENAYGLFSVVGSVIGFAAVFNSVMANSNSRFFAVAIGEGRRLGAEHGRKELNVWFNTSFSVHLVMATVLCVILWPVGDWLILHRLKIAAEQVHVAQIVFRISLGTLFVATLNAPFLALYTAKQFIFVRNATSMLQSILVACEGWWLLHFSGNRILGHSIAQTLIFVFANGLLAILAFRAFPETRLQIPLWFSKNRIRQLFSYAFFTMFGSLGGFFSGPCVNLVANLFHGTSANAVIGVGRRFASSMDHLSEAITSAVFPEVSSRVGAADIKKAENIAVLSSFLSCLPICMFGVPFLFWMPSLMQLLLKNPPTGAAAVTNILVITSLVLRMTSGYQMLVHASGRIKWYQMTLGTINMCCALVLWLLLACGASLVPALGVAWILPRSVLSIGRLLFAHRIVGITPSRFLRIVFLPVSACLVIAIAICTAFLSLTGNDPLWLLPCIAINSTIVGFIVIRFHPDASIRSLPNRILARIRK